MRITIRYYHPSGDLAMSRDFDTPELAFDDMLATRMEALAHPVGTTSGCYSFNPTKEGHTLEGFKDKLAVCCNNPAEYSNNLIRAGICAPSLLRNWN